MGRDFKASLASWRCKAFFVFWLGFISEPGAGAFHLLLPFTAAFRVIFLYRSCTEPSHRLDTLAKLSSRDHLSFFLQHKTPQLLGRPFDFASPATLSVVAFWPNDYPCRFPLFFFGYIRSSVHPHDTPSSFLFLLLFRRLLLYANKHSTSKPTNWRSHFIFTTIKPGPDNVQSFRHIFFLQLFPLQTKPNKTSYDPSEFHYHVPSSLITPTYYKTNCLRKPFL